jgi:AcrR family transcriptional regulator
VAAGRSDHATREEIARAALSLIDRDGLESLTMRNLAAEVRLTPRALYNHFSGKGEVIGSVIDLIWDEAYAEMDPPEPGDLDWVIDVCVVVRRVFLSHPDVALYVTASPKADERLLVSLAAFVHFMELGAYDDLYRSFHALIHFTMGSIGLSAARRVTTVELGRDEAAMRAWVSERVGDLEHPTTPTAVVMRCLLPEANDELFESELRLLMHATRDATSSTPLVAD